MQSNEMAKNIQAIMRERTVHYKEAIISILLGLPDGITYLAFGISAGQFLASSLSLTGFAYTFLQYMIAFGAALGVAFFAINNVSREYSNVFKKNINTGYKQNYSFFRNVIRYACVFVAVISAIPFAGMAMSAAHKLSLQGALFLLLVLSNAFARTAMNDYALSHIIGNMFDRIILLFKFQRSSSPINDTRLRFLRALNVLRAQGGNLSHADLMTIRRKIFKNPLVILSSVREEKKNKNLVIPGSLFITIMGFVAGAFTATYLYGFAVKGASELLSLINVHNHYVSHLAAIWGVVPTCFLWGNETMIALASIFTFFYRLFEKVLKGQVKSHAKPDSPLKYQLAVKVFFILLFALAGAYSEIRMAFLSGQSSILLLCAPIAFASIYSVCVVELIDKVYSMLGQKFYAGHVHTLRSEISYFSMYAKQFILRVEDSELLELMDKYNVEKL